MKVERDGDFARTGLEVEAILKHRVELALSDAFVKSSGELLDVGAGSDLGKEVPSDDAGGAVARQSGLCTVERQDASRGIESDGSKRKVVEIIGAPLDLGCNMRGANIAPATVRIAGLQDKLAALGIKSIDSGDVHVDRKSVV